MKIKRNGLVFNDNNYFYINDNNFQYDKIWYEKDEDNKRCYMLEDSICLKADCDGKLAKRRIKAIEYNNILNELKNIMAE